MLTREQNDAIFGPSIRVFRVTVQINPGEKSLITLYLRFIWRLFILDDHRSEWFLPDQTHSNHTPGFDATYERPSQRSTASLALAFECTGT
jgi:hypothetical protein